jgi:hypothetical protein
MSFSFLGEIDMFLWKSLIVSALIGFEEYKIATVSFFSTLAFVGFDNKIPAW